MQQKEYEVELCGSKVCIIDFNDQKWYRARDVSKILNIRNFHTSLTSLTDHYKKPFISNTKGGRQKTIFLNDDGMLYFVKSSRSLKANELANELGISNKLRFPSLEETFLRHIVNCFSGENMIHQFTVCKYRIDLYFVDYNLAIECDEPSHFHGSQPLKDLEREEIIKNKIGCNFIRFNPCQKNFDVTSVINSIFKHIKISLSHSQQ